MEGKFSINSTKDGNYFFNLKRGNGETVITSESYRTKQSALDSIEAVRRNSKNIERFQRKVTEKGQFFFILTAENHEVIGISSSYTSKQKMEDDIAFVRELGATQKIEKIQSDKKTPKILIVAALKEELEYLINLKIVEEGQKYHKSGLGYYEGFNNEFGITTIAVYSIETGLVDTAITTSKAINIWNPLIVAMIGICAGKENTVNLGDAIIAKKCFLYQIGAFSDGNISSEIRSVELNQLISRYFMEINDQDLEVIKEDYSGKGKTPDNKLRCFLGPMASADLLVRDDSMMLKAIDLDRTTIALDMESYAFMRACHQHNIMFYFVTKGVTDHGNKLKNDDFREYSKYVSTSIYKKIVEIILKNNMELLKPQ